jgi:hypothetical protein
MRGTSRWRSSRFPPGVEPGATPAPLSANPDRRARTPSWDTLRREVGRCARLAGHLAPNSPRSGRARRATFPRAPGCRNDLTLNAPVAWRKVVRFSDAAIYRGPAGRWRPKAPRSQSAPSVGTAVLGIFQRLAINRPGNPIRERPVESAIPSGFSQRRVAGGGPSYVSGPRASSLPRVPAAAVLPFLRSGSRPGSASPVSGPDRGHPLESWAARLNGPNASALRPHGSRRTYPRERARDQWTLTPRRSPPRPTVGCSGPVRHRAPGPAFGSEAGVECAARRAAFVKREKSRPSLLLLVHLASPGQVEGGARVHEIAEARVAERDRVARSRNVRSRGHPPNKPTTPT